MKRRNLLWIVLLILLLCGIGIWFWASGDSSPEASEAQVAEEPAEAPAVAAAPEPAAAPALEPVPESEPAPAVEDAPAPAKTADRAPRRAPRKMTAAAQETQEPEEEVYEPSRDEAAGTAVSKQDELPPPDDDAAAAEQATEQAAPLVQGTTKSVFRNKVGSWYLLQKVTCYIDGVEAFAKAGDFKEAELFDGPLPVGEHVFTVVAEYQGEGGALFSYLDGYGFNVKAGSNFNVEAGREAKIEVTAYERRGATTKFEDRLALSIEIK